MSSYQQGPGQLKTSHKNKPHITIEGLSTDTKPSATTYAGYYFYENDTGNTYLAYNGAWNKVSTVNKVLSNTTIDNTNNFSSTSGTATAGAATLPVNPAGFISTNVGGAAKKLVYYNV